MSMIMESSVITSFLIYGNSCFFSDHINSISNKCKYLTTSLPFAFIAHLNT